MSSGSLGSYHVWVFIETGLNTIFLHILFKSLQPIKLVVLHRAILLPARAWRWWMLGPAPRQSAERAAEQMPAAPITALLASALGGDSWAKF